MQSVRIQYSVSRDIRWRSGWSRGLSRFTTDFRVKGGDGHGQLGSVRDHFWGKYIFVRRADGAICAGRLLYEVQAPCGAPRTDPEQTQNTQTTPLWDHLGRRGPWHSETSRPGDPADCSVFNWPCVVLFGFCPLLAACGLLCSRIWQKEKTSVSQVTSVDNDKLQASLYYRSALLWLRAHPSISVNLSCCVQARAGRPFRAAAVMGKCLSPLLGIPRSRSLCS